MIANKPKPRNAEDGARWVNSGLQEIIFLSRQTLKRIFWDRPPGLFLTLKLSKRELLLICICWSFISICMIMRVLVSRHTTGFWLLLRGYYRARK